MNYHFEFTGVSENLTYSFLYKMFNASFLIAFLTLVPFVLFLGIMLLEVGVSFIQAYVFTILTCSYIKDSIELH